MNTSRISFAPLPLLHPMEKYFFVGLCGPAVNQPAVVAPNVANSGQTTTTTTTTTTTSTSSQVNKQLVVGTSTTSFNLGNYVTGVSMLPYIPPQVISFVAYNMRPSTRLHVFFNSINVDEYCAPGIPNPNTSIDSASNQFVLQTADFGTQVVSDAHGVCCGQFNVPDSTFKTGSLVLELADVASIVEGNNAITTSAFAAFQATNIGVTTQGITLTTINPIVSVANVVNTVVTQNVVSNSVSVTVPSGGVNVYLQPYYDPIAQVFRFSMPNGEVGAYITSIDLFLFQKSLTANNGVTLYICDTDTNSDPNSSSILPFSTIHLGGDQLNVSNSSLTATNFKFEAPVFVNADTNYAFVVKPDNSDPDILLFFARLGDIDLSTGVQVYSQPNAGTAYEGATASGWSALQSEYVKFTVHCAKFSNTYGTAVFHNTDRDYLEIGNVSYVNNSVGVRPGDVVFGAANTQANTAATSANGTLHYYNLDTEVLYIDQSSGNFTGQTAIQVHRFANLSVATPNNTTLIASANLVSINDIPLNVYVAQYNSIAPSGTQIRWSGSATNNGHTLDSNAFQVNVDASTNLFDYERLVVSKSNESADMSGNKSLMSQATLISDSPYLSPLIDTVRSDVLAVSNKIDPLSLNLYNEMYTYGTTQSKYLSLPVTLATGQTAEDIQVVIDAYRPYSTFIKVYARFLNSEDPDALFNKTWTPLVSDGDGLYSAFGDTADYKTFNFHVPYGYGALAANGTVTVNATSNAVTGSGTSFTTQLEPGFYINILGDSARRVVTITSDTALTLDSPFTAVHTSNGFFIVPPPTTAWLSTNTSIQSLGTITTNTGNNTIVGSSTAFTSWFEPGSIISDGSDSQVVVSVVNNTILTVGTPWSANASGSNVFLVSLPGINYLNTAKNLYTGYDSFQIKIVLLSNDSSKVPLLKDAQAIAKQT